MSSPKADKSDDADATASAGVGAVKSKNAVFESYSSLVAAFGSPQAEAVSEAARSVGTVAAAPAEEPSVGGGVTNKMSAVQALGHSLVADTETSQPTTALRADLETLERAAAAAARGQETKARTAAASASGVSGGGTVKTTVPSPRTAPAPRTRRQVASAAKRPISPNRSQPRSRGTSPVRPVVVPQYANNHTVRKRSGSTTSAGPSGGGGTQTHLRRGKWTAEEETYVARVIADFNAGLLNAPAGTTLRTYLSEKLQCDPMRITKKFTGEACIGKRVFHPAVQSPSNTAIIRKAQAELEELEQKWRRRLELQQSESAKKQAAAASAVAVAAAAAGTAGNTASGFLGDHNGSIGTTCAPTLVQAAGWLERAKSSLDTSSENVDEKQLSREEIVAQMEQVQRLLREGTVMPSVAEPGDSSAVCRPPKVVVTTTTITPPESALTTAPSSGDSSGNGNANSNHKRQRSEPVDDSHEAAPEDAAALVNFLQTVQAAAAAQDTL